MIDFVVSERPADGEPQGLALLLHGRGADEKDLMAFTDLFSPRVRVLGLRAPYSYGPGFAWYPMAPDGSPLINEWSQSVARLDAVIDQVGGEVLPVFLLGFSQGGQMAVATAMKRRARNLLGVASLSAPPVPESSQQRALEGLPVFWAHGRHDPVVSWQRGQAMRRDLRKMGALVTENVYAMGHEISKEEISDLAKFLGSLRK